MFMSLLYDLSDTKGLNFNFSEVESISVYDADIIFLTYLAFNYNKKLPRVELILRRLGIIRHPSTRASKFLIPIRNSRDFISKFKFKDPVSKLKSTRILTENISPDYKVEYLRLVSLCPPYSHSKFVPEKTKSSVLVLHKFLAPVENGVILTAERGVNDGN